MKNLSLLFFLFSFITLTIISNAQTVIPPGPVSGTWTLGGSPYEIQGEITIPNGLTLTIEQRVLVVFQGHYKLNVQGRLLAVGTEADTIVFTINDTTGFHNPNIPDGGWFGIRFSYTQPTNDSSKIVYCKLQYGKAVGITWPDNCGGAISVEYYDKLLISHCLITNNSAGGTDFPSGGGVDLIYSNPKIVENTISNNSAFVGGGIHFSTSSPIFTNNTISNNNAEAGGGILFEGTSNTIIMNSTIINNNATGGGGGMCFWNSSPSFETVIVDGNTAGDGGGINLYESSPQFVDNLIINNSAEAGGGIVCNENSNPTITNSTIDNNTATDGGGGGIICWYNSNPILDNVTFSNNSASWGGGISTLASNLQIDNC